MKLKFLFLFTLIILTPLISANTLIDSKACGDKFCDIKNGEGVKTCPIDCLEEKPYDDGFTKLDTPTLEIGNFEVKTTDSNILWLKKDNMFYPEYKDDTKYDLTLDSKNTTITKKKLKPLTNFTFNVNKLEETTCQTNNQFLTTCKKEYLDFSEFEKKNNITNKTINPVNYNLDECLFFPNWKLIYVWELKDCMNSIKEYDITYYGNIIDLDPSLEYTFTSSEYGIYNQTEATDNGVRLIPNNVTGDFSSFVFYNSTSTYWQTILGHNATEGNNITLETRTADSYNLSDDGLVAHWSMQDRDGTTVIDLKGDNNGTAEGGVSFGEEYGVVGEGGDFDGIEGSYINYGNDNSLSSDNMTYSLWFKSSSAIPSGNPEGLLFKAPDTGANREISISFSPTGNLTIIGGDGFSDISTRIDSPTSYYDSNWHFAVIVKEYEPTGDNLTLFVDGVKIEEIKGTYNIVQNSANLESGRVSSSSIAERYYNGSIDEVRVYNRSLSADEVKQLYEMGSNFIEWNEWQDEGVIENNVGDASSTDGKFFQYKSIFNTNDSSVSPYLLNYSITPTHVDLIAPTFTTIPNNATLEYKTDSLGISFGAEDETKFDSYYLGNWTDTFEINSTGYLSNKTSLDLGTYVINVSINDTTGNTNMTWYQVDVTDTTAPVITIHSPLEETTDVLQQLINISATDLQDVNTIWYNWNGTKVIYTEAIITTFNYSEHTLHVWANDSSGNKGYLNRTFIILDDIEPPQYSNIQNPSNDEWLNNPFCFNITWTDNLEVTEVNLNLSNVEYIMDDFGPDDYSLCLDLSAGSYNYRYNANDIRGNFNQTSEYELIVSKSTPTISLTSSAGWTIVPDSQTTITGTCQSGMSCNLFQDESGISNPLTDFFSAGSYLFLFNTTGNTNYSAREVSNTLLVQNISESISGDEICVTPAFGYNYLNNRKYTVC